MMLFDKKKGKKIKTVWCYVLIYKLLAILHVAAPEAWGALKVGTTWTSKLEHIFDGEKLEPVIGEFYALAWMAD